MSIEYAVITPHPPLIIPEVGGRYLGEVSSTVTSMINLGKKIREISPETLIIVSPHCELFLRYFGIVNQERISGDFRDFGAPGVRLEFEIDLTLTQKIISSALESGLPVREIVDAYLDHGAMVPLYYLTRELDYRPKIVLLSFSFLPLEKIYSFGKVIDSVTEGNVVFVASGDMSHRLLPGAPNGYDPMGKIFDQAVAEIVKSGDLKRLLELDSEIVERAGECGLRSLVMLAGVMNGKKIRTKLLSYEGPFGVGYLVGEVISVNSEDLESYILNLAREAVETYVRERRVITPQNIPEELNRRAGAFVTIKKHGELRGCIGTIQGTQSNLAYEIIQNAISSATQDPRFPPVSKEELPELEYSVDILNPPEKITDISQLDPKIYGVIVERGWQRGLLLPDLEGVDTVEEQLRIAALKAGLSLDEVENIYRFTVTRYGKK
ncbi:MAG: AmmeMemoRadiSam system protein A [bacterium]|nr:AmmeMemoRadiSam system protein A [bacterium]